MDIKIARCIITKSFHSDKSGMDYLTLEEGDSTINLSSGDLDLSRVPLLDPVSVVGRVTGHVYNGKMSLSARDLTITPLNTSKA